MEIAIEQQRLVLNRIAKAKQNPKRLLDWNEAVKTLRLYTKFASQKT